MTNPGSALARGQLHKAGRIAKWIYKQSEMDLPGALSRSELVEYMHEFQDLMENPAHLKFWISVADAAGERRPSQDTINLLIEILDIVEDIRGE